MEIAVHVEKALGLPDVEGSGMNPFVKIAIKACGAKRGSPKMTTVLPNHRNPVWDEDITLISETPESDTVTIRLYRDDSGKSVNVCEEIAFPVADLPVGLPIPKVLQLYKGKKKEQISVGSLHLTVECKKREDEEPHIEPPQEPQQKQEQKHEEDQPRERPIEKETNERPLSSLLVDIEKYVKIERIGHGGLGEVWRCKKDGVEFAVKYMEATTERRQAIFEREIAILGAISHPFVVGFHGHSIPLQGNPNFCIVMDYIRGGSLHDVILNHPSWFNGSAKIALIYAIAIGMSDIAGRGIIHRDLKPMNILLDEKHLPRICDFGSSRLFDPDTSVTEDPDITARYAAPELYGSNGYNNKVDVYAFGVTLYEILAEKLAFQGMTRLQLMGHVVGGKREEIDSKVITPFAEELIKSCWAQEPENRPSFDDICAILSKKMHLLTYDSDINEIMEFISYLKTLPVSKPL